jgi:gluconokinase
MGVSGSGKSTIGQMLAESLGWEFHDGDDLHPEANKRKMHSGLALTDEDRAPWLLTIRNLISSIVGAGRNAVIACSALKQSYRDQIVVDPAAVKIVFLKGSAELIASRIQSRIGHFMSPTLLQSQFDTLEEPRDAIVVDIDASPAEIVRAIRAQILPNGYRPLN